MRKILPLAALCALSSLAVCAQQLTVADYQQAEKQLSKSLKRMMMKVSRPLNLP